MRPATRAHRIVCFANAKLPDSDYRNAFARTSQHEVWLALPQKPDVLEPDRFIEVAVGEGLTVDTVRRLASVPRILKARRATVAMFFATQFTVFGPLLARVVGVVPVITITGLGRSFRGVGLRGRLLRWVYLAAFRLNTHLSGAILFQNPSDMARLTAHAGRSVQKKCHLVGSGIDTDFFASVARGQRAYGDVLFVGRLLPEKGVQDFLSLTGMAAPGRKFVMVGPHSHDHPDLAEQVELAHDAGLVKYRGQLSSAEVRAQLSESRVLVLSSHAEGLPRVAMEAILSGVPVVAYDIPGCRAALGDDYPLVPLRDIAALGAELERVCADTAYSEALVGTARAFILENCSAQSYVAKVESIVAELD